MAPMKLYDKIHTSHTVVNKEGELPLLYVDSHIVYEITSPQAFDSLRSSNRTIRRPDLTIATVDHNIPTLSRKHLHGLNSYITDPQSKLQVATLERNVRHHSLTYFGLNDRRQGIVHVIGPEQGFAKPGTILVCGDSHTGTNGAFGNLALGIGTSEVEHVLATQTIRLQKFKNMRITVEGKLHPGVEAKDLMLHIVGTIGFAGATGHVVEYAGSTIRNMSMEARMTICNMSIEAGGRAGLIAPDDVTFAYMKGRPFAPREHWEEAVSYWRTLVSDEGAIFDKEVYIDATQVVPTVSWGTTPQEVSPVTGVTPDPSQLENPTERRRITRALDYMGLKPNMKIADIKIDKVFIGSCTNARIEDLRSAAMILRGRTVSPNVTAIVVPGSGLVKRQAEEEGLDKVFLNAGFEWREAGCSMCPGINPDRLSRGERCASTSNRNLEDRQGLGGRTHLMSPVTAAATALTGFIANIYDYPPLQTEETEIVQDQELAPQPTPPNTDQLRSLDQTSDSEPSDQLTSKSNDGLTTIKGVAAPLHLSNVDTDMIIPGKYLAVVKKTGLGKALFTSLRYDAEGKPKPDFVLNKPPGSSAKFLFVTGENFGCGSSREHAVWALKDFGIRVVVAPSFAGIFFNNAFKNGVLPVVLPSNLLAELAAEVEKDPQVEFELNLPEQVLIRPNGERIGFEVEEFKKYCMINALDEIDLALQHEESIRRYEQWRSKQFPWLEEKCATENVKLFERKPDKHSWEW
jgi:3-isopropylmalate dehydratase